MSENIILSVIVPTYNRYEYLKGCIETTLSIESDDFELIIHDNTEDNSSFLPFVKSIKDERLRYYHKKEHVSVSDNSDLAMSYARGNYICMIGDDDTICESLIDAAHYCEKENIDAINYLIAGFNWPDMTFEGTKEEANMFFRYKASGVVRIMNHSKELHDAITSANGLLDTMPRAYHGLVSKKVMERIYDKTGSYFPGPSPDMGNAAAVCLVANRTAFIYDYLIVSGYGYKSARGEGNRKAHYGKLKDKPWLPKDILERWDKDIPPIFSAETITADSLTESLRRMGRDDLTAKYNYASLYAIFLGHHRDAVLQMMGFCLKNPKRIIRLMKGIITRSKMRKEYKKNPPDQTFYREEMGVKTLQEALEIVRKTRQDLQIDKYVLTE